jgi:hypothetical protein
MTWPPDVSISGLHDPNGLQQRWHDYVSTLFVDGELQAVTEDPRKILDEIVLEAARHTTHAQFLAEGHVSAKDPELARLELIGLVNRIRARYIHHVLETLPKTISLEDPQLAAILTNLSDIERMQMRAKEQMIGSSGAP